MSGAAGSDAARDRDEETSLSNGVAQLVAACEKLASPGEEEAKQAAWEALCNDALGHMACEGSLFIEYERDNSGKIDYGRHNRVDPRFKLKQWRIAPMTLLPTPISRVVYDLARDTSMAMCRLLDAISTDYAWLESTFRELSKLDEWTRRMLSLARLDDGGVRLRCHCVRADYMEEAGKLNTIEVNPFAASLAGHAESMSLTHRRLVAKYACADRDALSESFPANHPAAGFADCLASAVAAYENRFGRHCASAPPVVAVITVAEEDNELDHRKLERCLYDKHGITVIRVTIAELIELLCAADDEILAEGEPLVLQLSGIGECEVAVCYFRLCAWGRYGVEGWRVREAIANSRAVEVPSAAAHLAGLKRAQVEWSSKRGLDRLGDKLSATDKEAILRVALPQFALDTAASALQAQSAISIDLNRAFVAKPVRQMFNLGKLLHRAAMASAVAIRMSSIEPPSFTSPRKHAPYHWLATRGAGLSRPSQNHSLSEASFWCPTHLLTMRLSLHDPPSPSSESTLLVSLTDLLDNTLRTRSAPSGISYVRSISKRKTAAYVAGTL